MSYEQKLKQLGLELPAPPKPVANYVPAVRVGDLLFLSGVLPSRDGQLIMTGKLGQGITIEQGVEAARVSRSRDDRTSHVLTCLDSAKTYLLKSGMLRFTSQVYQFPS